MVLLDLDKWFLGEREFRERKKARKKERLVKEIKKEKEHETEKESGEDKMKRIKNRKKETTSMG